MIEIGVSLWACALWRGGLAPPPGFVFVVDDDGVNLTDDDGYYVLEAI